MGEQLPMKVAVISDIHANRQAFEAVLEAIAASDASELWCLGDLVGYGADPDACVELVRRHAASCRWMTSRAVRASPHSGPPK
jgi:Icc-related predicted phosphoesterase